MTILVLQELKMDPAFDKKLGDGRWKQARICDLITGNHYTNTATLISLSKKYAADPASALVYLLQKQLITMNLWQEDHQHSISDFIDHLSICGRFSNMQGREMAVDIFRERYTSTVKGLTSEPSFEFSEDGVIKPYDEKILKEDIVRVISFDDTWNEQNYLVETRACWFLFSWLTMA